jgi:hypothetical protein
MIIIARAPEWRTNLDLRQGSSRHVGVTFHENA